MVFKILFVIAIGLLLYRVARNNGANPIVFAVVAPIAFPLLWVGFATIRAQMFTLGALALTMLMLQADWRGNRKWILAWFLLYLAWLNLHAGFVVGVGLVAFHTIERVILAIDQERTSRTWRSLRLELTSKALYQKIWNAVWHLLVLVPFLVLGTCVNPWTWEYIPYLVRAITMPRPTILEWLPLWHTHDAWSTLSVFGVSVLLLVYVAVERDWRRLRGWMFCVLAAYMALKHIRHGSLYAVVWIAYMPGWITHTELGRWIVAFAHRKREQTIFLSRGLGLVSASFVFAYPIWLPTFPTDLNPLTMNYPVGVVQHMEKHQINGNVMAPFHCGAYLTWKLYPQVKVSLDGRYEVAYQPGVYEDHLTFYEATPGWPAILDKYDHDYIVLPVNAPVAKFLITDEAAVSSTICDWTTIYQDESYILLKRDR